MEEHDQPGLPDRLQRVRKSDALRLVAEALKQATELNRLLVEQVLPHKPADTAEEDLSTTTEVARPHRRVIEEWNTYAGFRADMQRRERKALLTNKGPVTALMLANQTGGDSERNIRRVMRDHGLARLWPPSKWPEKQPHPPDIYHPRR